MVGAPRGNQIKKRSGDWGWCDQSDSQSVPGLKGRGKGEGGWERGKEKRGRLGSKSSWGYKRTTISVFQVLKATKGTVQIEHKFRQLFPKRGMLERFW